MSGRSSQPRTSNATRSTGTVPCVVRKARTLAEENLKERRRRPTGTCDSWYGTEGWMRVQYQLEHELPPSGSDPSRISPARRRRHQVVAWLWSSATDMGPVSHSIFFFVYHEQLISQSQVTRSCMRCCSDPFSLESEEDPWKGGGQPVEHNATTTVSGSHRRQVRPAASLIAYVQFQRCCASVRSRSICWLFCCG